MYSEFQTLYKESHITRPGALSLCLELLPVERSENFLVKIRIAREEEVHQRLRAKWLGHPCSTRSTNAL